MSAALPAHLVHGMGTALEAPTWPAITTAEAEGVIGRFPGAGRLVGLRWHSPRPFSAATLLQTSRGEFLLKRHHRRLRSPEDLAQEHAFVAHLRAAGLPVSEIIMSADRQGAFAQGDWTYELHRKAPGIDLYRDRLSWTPFLSNGHAFTAGVALAQLHVAARTFTAPTRAARPLVASFTILPSPDPLAAAEAYVADRPALAGYLADKPWRRELGRLFATFGDGLPERLAGHRTLWTHNDWHPSNLMWTADGEVASIIDFGLATRTSALHDLATAIERTAIEWLRLGEGADIAQPDAAIALLAGYRSIVALDASEIETVVRLLPLVHVEFALSEIDYFAGIVSAPQDAAIAWHDYLIGHAEWFLSAPARDFGSRIMGAATA
ncbi:phosphotransferase enzyme family protein [Sphingomonas oryzagri]|uniref:Phosphotransferase n=1 Tax=Sphingomonas oryzagri TaxID=3042314 RepID=A0ABT6N4V9_9SPHN|nr:phosphotransferase [Sphingomonas oryzagri]MDH7639996.1 phosphotransferase [Sphingomonas oryzagri]